jgi:Protein of unknown function (DUF4238)
MQMEQESGEKIDVDEYQRKLTGGSAYAKQTSRAWSLKQMFESMMRLQRDIYEMFWTFLIAPQGEAGFLTSDNPVGFFHPDEVRHTKINSVTLMEAHFTFPISKGFCLLAQPFPNPGQVTLSTANVRRINRNTATRADNQLYAPFISEPLQELFVKIQKHIKRNPRVLLRHGRVVVEWQNEKLRSAEAV